MFNICYLHSEYSMQLNASRIKVLQAQDDITSMKEAAGKELVRVSEDKKAYKKLMKDLIVQVAYIIMWYENHRDVDVS